MKFMLILFTGTYMFRVFFALVLHYKEEWIHGVFESNNTLFMMAVLGLWMIWDCVPLVAMLFIHK